MKKLQLTYAATTLIATLAWPAFGGVMQVDTLADLGANDQVLWATNSVPNGPQINVTSTNNVMVTLTEAGTFAEEQQAPMGAWSGDFPANAYIIDNQWYGPTTIDFSTAVLGFGVYVDNAWSSSPATATIDAFNGTTMLGSFQVTSTGLQFLGVSDPVAEITSVTITSDSSNGKGYYAFGDLNIIDALPVTNIPAPSGVPEPASAGLALAGAVLAVVLRRRLAKN